MILSIFPGIDVLGLGFEEAGYTVVRGPDPMCGSLHDIRRFHPPAGVFRGVIGGPPCQAHSKLAAVVRARYGEEAVAEDLIPEFSRVVAEAAPRWFLMENVPGAPAPHVKGYAVHTFLLNNRWLGQVQNRLRRFWFGVRGSTPVDLRPYIRGWVALEPAAWSPAVLASGAYRGGRGKVRLSAKRGPSRATVREGLRLQGLPEDFFDKSPFTVEGQQRLVGNAVPLPMARTLAEAIARWEEETMNDQPETQYEDKRCAICGQVFDPAEMVEVEEDLWVCETCAVNEYGWQPIPEELLQE